MSSIIRQVPFSGHSVFFGVFDAAGVSNLLLIVLSRKKPFSPKIELIFAAKRRDPLYYRKREGYIGLDMLTPVPAGFERGRGGV